MQAPDLLQVTKASSIILPVTLNFRCMSTLSRAQQGRRWEGEQPERTSSYSSHILRQAFLFHFFKDRKE